jgi:hypothetical protein
MQLFDIGNCIGGNVETSTEISQYWMTVCSINKQPSVVYLLVLFSFKNTVNPSHNDPGLCAVLSIASDILWYQLVPHC